MLISNQCGPVFCGGTITRAVHDLRGPPLSICIGTNDTGAAGTDPSRGAFLPLPPGEGRGEGGWLPVRRYDISPRPTAAERAALKAFAGSGGSSSSSSKCGGIDCTTDCHCVCDCPCSNNGTQVPVAAPQTSVPNGQVTTFNDFGSA